MQCLSVIKLKCLIIYIYNKQKENKTSLTISSHTCTRQYIIKCILKYVNSYIKIFQQVLIGLFAFKVCGKKTKRDRETSYADIKGHNAAQKR